MTTAITTLPLMLGPNGPIIDVVASDPTAGAGRAGAVGSLVIYNGQHYRKTGAGNTQWEITGQGGGGGSTITPGLVQLAGNEDTEITGNVLAQSTTTQGTLSVMQWTVAGVAGIYQPGDELLIPGSGVVTIAADGALVFGPLLHWNGSVPAITVQMTNGVAIAIAQTVITVAAVNDPPVANNVSRVALVGEAIQINLIASSYDPDGDGLTVTQLNGIAATTDPIDLGDAVIVWDGDEVVTFTPDAEFAGEVSFGYTVSDGQQTSTGTVTVLVGVDEVPMLSAAAPLSPSDPIWGFTLTYQGLVGDAYGNGTNVTSPVPYGASQGYFTEADRVPYLYDRATTIYKLYRRTRDPAVRARALYWAEQYMQRVEVDANDRASFVAGTASDYGDPKYLYAIIAEWVERETGSTSYREKAIAIYNRVLQYCQKAYNPASAALWTERNNGWIAIETCHALYHLRRRSGNIIAANVALQDAVDYFESILAMSAASGAPLHLESVHEGNASQVNITSPWMTALAAEAIVQLYRTTGDARIPAWLSGYGDFLIDNAFYTAIGNEVPGIGGNRLAAYMVGANSYHSPGDQELFDAEHTPDMGGLLDKVIWAKRLLNEPSGVIEAFEELREEQRLASLALFAYYDRATPGLPRFRVNPAHKGGWWLMGSYSNADLVVTGVLSLAPVVTAAPVITGGTQQGSELSISNGSWDGTAPITYAYQWTRDGENIAGATASTYTTQLADVGTDVSGYVVGSNDAGNATAQASNAISVVAAGAPEFTLQPVNVQRAVGQTATFTVAVTGSPSPSVQWQISTNGGESWTDANTGTGFDTVEWTTAALAEGNDGNLVRARAQNANGTVYSDTAAIAMIVEQDAVRFAGAGVGADMTLDIGQAGATNFTLITLARLEGRNSTGNIIGARHTTNGRELLVQCTNTFDTYNVTIGDSQTGFTAGGFSPQPNLNEWFILVLRGSEAAGGTATASWAPLSDPSALTHVTRVNGVDASVQMQAIRLNGGAANTGITAGAAFQHVRGYNSILTDEQIEALALSTDLSGALFCWVFEDDGGGGVEVRDATGNNRVPTITGGTLAAGPTVASMP